MISVSLVPSLQEDRLTKAIGKAILSIPNPLKRLPPVPVPPRPSSPDSRLISDDKILSDARAASASFTDSLPSFLVQQATSRYFSTSGPKLWRLLDTVTAELAYANGKEEYRNIEVDGRPPNRPVDQTGSWSTGEFATTLDDLLSEDTEADFRRRGEATIASRSAVVYDFTVAQTKSHWTIIAPDKREYSPAYRGAIWIDKETRRVLRIEQRTTEMPPDFPVGQAESILDYAYVPIDQKPYLLPARGENIGCTSGTGACTRNVIEFRNYRKFTAESSVKF